MFTMIPLDVEGEEVVGLSKRFHLIVLVGAFYGLIAGSLMWALSQVFSTLTAGVLALLVVHALNRFLHFDGLSDFGDGMICSGDQEKKMRAVKDSHTGAGGIGYSIVFTALSIVALGELSPQLVFFGPFLAELLNKNAMVFAASAGSSREGLGGIFVKNASGKTAAMSALISLAFIIPVSLGFYWYYDLSIYWLVFMIVAPLAISCAVGTIAARIAMKGFGCVNGDVLGATNEFSRPFVLLTVSAVVWCLATLHW
jgi:adenosylcobinamide-GDP ribazoletransferase